MRLILTPSIRTGNAGRLEICRNGVWGTVSWRAAAFWPTKNVLVACRELGYDVGLNSIPTAGYVCV